MIIVIINEEKEERKITINFDSLITIIRFPKIDLNIKIKKKEQKNFLKIMLNHIKIKDF